MSMFSCLGNEAITIRDSFVNRLSARTEVKDIFTIFHAFSGH